MNLLEQEGEALMNELELKYGCNPNQKPARVFMEQGKLIEQGAPDVLLAECSTTRTRDFCQRLLEMGG